MLDFEGEENARKQLLIARTETGPKSAAAWIEVGEFIAESDFENWSGLTAETCFRAALDLLPAGAQDGFRADALLGYGSALTGEGSGYRDEVLEEASRYLTEAIALFEKIPDPEGVLEARYYRAYAWTELVGPTRFKFGQMAIEELEDIQEIVKNHESEILSANVFSLLGNAYLDRVEGDPRQNNLEAERAFRSALAVHQKMGSVIGRAQSNLDLAVTFNRRNVFGDNKANRKAVYYAKRAANFVGEEIHLELATTILSTYAKALQDRGGRQWVSNTKKAEALIAKGIQLARASKNLPVEQALRLTRAQILLDLCQYAGLDRVIDVQADLDASRDGLDPEGALTWWLQWQEIASLLAAVTGNTQRMIETAEDSLAQVMIVLEQADSFAEKAEYLSRVSFVADLGILGHLSENGPPAGLRFARRVFARLIGTDTAVFATSEGVAELYLLNPVTPDWSGVLVSAGEDCTFYEIEGVGKDFWNAAIDELRPGFFSGMSALSNPGGLSRFAEMLEEWICAASGALGPVLFDLQIAGYEEIVVFAFGGWCTVPVAALQLPGPGGTTLTEQAAVVYGPDQFIPHEPRTERVLHVLDPRLVEAEAENRMLNTVASELFSCASLQDVQEALAGAQAFDCIHFTTHGDHDFDYLEGAGIRCADDGLLTARWVFEHARLKGGPLVCLAACQTGLNDFANLPHETFGLPMAFLSAGASAVLSTQWPVDDVATRLLLTQFYLEVQGGRTTAKALQLAQHWLRDADEATLEAQSTGNMRFTPLENNGPSSEAPPFSHPYFWAGFLLHRA